MQIEELDITTSSQSEMKRVLSSRCIAEFIKSLGFYSNFWPSWPTYSAGFLALSPGPIRACNDTYRIGLRQHAEQYDILLGPRRVVQAIDLAFDIQ
jgi:hypothetical protein